MNKRAKHIILLLIWVSSVVVSAQDSTAVKDISEDKELRFQQYFFKALSEKSITNYQKAIENLEICNGLIPDKPSVLFEFSKNFLLLNKTFEAKEYIQKALKIEPKNKWMLTHFVKVLSQENNYKEAINIQQQLLAIDPTKRVDLVYLYLRNREYQNAVSLMTVIEKEEGLSRSLKNLKRSLLARKDNISETKLDDDLASLVAKFESDSSFDVLQKILEKSETTDTNIFNTFSKKGLELFPAQPLVYLSRGKALNQQKKYSEALSVLETGLDFVIDNKAMLKRFYKSMAASFKGLNNPTKYQEYLKKVNN